MNTPISKELFKLFKSYKSKRFVLVEMAGNYGDYLIYKGAYKLADMAGLTYEQTTFENFMITYYTPDTVIYIHGGGGVNSFWSGKPITLLKKALSTHRGTVILGPQTFETEEYFLDQFNNKVLGDVVSEKIFIFCRELVSYDCLKQKLPENIELMIDHDTALNLTKDDFELLDMRSEYDLYSIRSDKELHPEQDYNFLSKWIDAITYSRNFDEWVSLHAGARKIVTNRLHSAVLGSILQIPTTLLPNSYHKNRAVWEFSLRPRQVRWNERLRVGFLSKILNQINFLKRFRQSKLCQRLIGQMI